MSEMNSHTESALDTYKRVRSRFYEVANELFGPGFMSMVEYYYMKKTGENLFATLFREPGKVYDYLANMMKGEKGAVRLIKEAVGPDYELLVKHMKRNDGHLVWTMLDNVTMKGSVISSAEKRSRAAAAQ